MNELFRKEPADRSNEAVWNACRKYTLDQMSYFFDEAYNTYGLGEIMYDPAYTDLTKAISKEVFLKSFNLIFQSFERVGTFENLISIIKVMFGNDAGIVFEKDDAAPGRLGIHISQKKINDSYWITKNDANRLITAEGDYLVFNEFLNEIYLDELKKLFAQLVPAGINFTITVNYLDEDEQNGE